MSYNIYPVRKMLSRFQTAKRPYLFALTADKTLKTLDTGTVYTNEGAAGAVTVTLPQNAPVGTEFTFVVAAAQEFRIDPGAGGAVVINGAKQTDDKYIVADDEGESVTLYANGSGDWLAAGTSGTWTVEA